MKLAKIESVYRPNLLVNGDFKIWQRGEAITIQGNGGKAYTADMWEIRNQRTSSAQMIHQKTDEGKGTGFGFPGLGSMRIYQWLPIEEMRQYDGRYMTRVWSVNKQVHSETFLLNLSASDGTIEGDKWRAFYYLSNSDDVLNYAALYPGKIAYSHFEEDDATALLRCQEWVYGLITEDYARLPLGHLSSDMIQIPLPFINFKSPATVEIGGNFDIRCIYPNWWNIAYVGGIAGATFIYSSKMFQFTKPPLSGSPESGQVFSVESQPGARIIITREPL